MVLAKALRPTERIMADEPLEPEETTEFEDRGDEPDGEGGYTTADFHNVVHKQIMNATFETLAATKLEWAAVEPFLRAAREMCRGDFERTGRIEIHAMTGEEDERSEAEEAYLGLSIADQDDGEEWLAQTWWLSDLVLAEPEPERVRETVRALERSIAKLEAWLESAQAKGRGEAG